MYEIWLVMNIVWELALSLAPVLGAVFLLWVLLMVLAWRGGGRWARALPRAAGTGAGVAVLAFLALPSLTQSSLSEMGYWVDWANLTAMALGCGAAAALFVWPVWAWVARARPASDSPNDLDRKSVMVPAGGAT